MSDAFLALLNIARSNIRQNPSLVGKTTEEISKEYLAGLISEVKEVSVEIKKDNQIYLQDELSDIAWVYACALAALEEKGYIESAEAIIEHSLIKYKERAPAFLEADEKPWEAFKIIQKNRLKILHKEKYGN